MATEEAPPPSIEQLVARYLRMGRRALRHWPLSLAIFAVCAGGAVLFALSKPRVYQSRTVVEYREVLIVGRAPGQEDTAGEGELSMRIKEALTSRTTLQKIIDEFGLYAKLKWSKSSEEIAEEMRNHIEFRSKEGANTFVVGFEGNDPQVVQKVTERLARAFVDAYEREKKDKAAATLKLRVQQADEAKKLFFDADTKLNTFLALHPEVRPDPMSGGGPGAIIHSLQGRRGRRAGGGVAKAPARVQMAAANNPVLREKLRLKGTLEAQLMSRRGQQQQPAGPTPTEEALREARAQLARMRSQLTEQHPDMLGLRARIRDLEQQSLREKRQRTAPGEDPEERALSAQIAELDAEITRLTQISAPRPRPVEEGTAETPRAPATPDPARLETEYNQLYKDREIAKARYEELEAQRKQTESWAAAITERAPLQFRVIDPAFLPVRPIKPSRRKMAMAGLALGLLFGIGAALGRVILDPRIYDEDDLRRASGLLVFASIPGSDRKEA